MKRCVMVVLVAFVVSGCSSAVTKNFKVVVDPPDSVITVVSGPDLKEMKYRSPAIVTAKVPTGSALASKAVLDVRRDDYKPLVIPLRDIKDGQTLNIKLDPMFRYRLSYRLVSPAASDTLQFRDSTVAVSFAVSDKSFQFRFENLTAHPVKILWERAEYTDVNMQGHRLMHSGIRFQDRNVPIPDQIVPSHAVVQETVIPVSKVYIDQKKKTYDIQPLFVRDNSAAAGLKGQMINLFIPVEVNRAIIPYNFKIEIDSVKETIQG